MPATSAALAASAEGFGWARSSLAVTFLRGCVAGLALAVGLEALGTLAGRNFHTVIPGAVYRCSQPTPRGLEAMVRAHGIRTVINLRGCCDPELTYLDECRATCRLGVSQEDIGFSSGRLPPVPSVRELVRVLDGSEKPVLLHCHKGIDRTGMASAVALLLYTDLTVAEARRQLGPRFGHLPFGPTGNMDRFFDLYSEWLSARGLAHSREAFRKWAETEYCAGECRARISLEPPVAGPVPAPPSSPFSVQVRCTNTSAKPWHLQPGNNAGVHAWWYVSDPGMRPIAFGLAGLFEATVQPGEHVDLSLALPSLKEPGRYRLFVDLEDERLGKFFQEGSEPLRVELEVP